MQGKVGRVEFIHQHIALLHVGQHNGAVLAFFPQGIGIVVLSVERHKLESEQASVQLRHIDAGHPLVVRVFHHVHGVNHRPVAQRVAFACNGEFLAFAQLRGTHFDAHRLFKLHLLAHLQRARSHAVGECRTVQVAVFGDVDPVVIHRVAATAGCHQFQAVGSHQPLVTQFPSITVHTVVVVNEITVFVGKVHFAEPSLAVNGCQGLMHRLSGIAMRHDVEHHFLTIVGLVIDKEFYFHRYILFLNSDALIWVNSY